MKKNKEERVWYIFTTHGAVDTFAAQTVLGFETQNEFKIVYNLNAEQSSSYVALN